MKCLAKNENDGMVLMEYALDKLPLAQRTLVAEHVHSCSDCSTVVAAHKSLNSSFDLWEPDAISRDFDRKLFTRIMEEESRSWKRFLPQFAVPAWRSTFMPAAALCAAMFAAALLHTPAVAPVPVKDTAHHLELSEVEQVESTLEDLEMLRQLSVPSASKKL